MYVMKEYTVDVEVAISEIAPEHPEEEAIEAHYSRFPTPHDWEEHRETVEYDRENDGFFIQRHASKTFVVEAEYQRQAWDRATEKAKEEVGEWTVIDPEQTN